MFTLVSYRHTVSGNNKKRHYMHKINRTLQSTRAALDLASIMIGVIVIGIIGGITAATVFAVIPWAQDNAAKSSLSSIATAESAYAGFNARFGTSTELTTQKLIQASTSFVVATNASGNCYVAVSKSPTKKLFYSTDLVKAKEYVAGTTNTSECVDVSTLISTLQ